MNQSNGVSPGVSLGTLEDLQAQANAAVQRETARQLGELMLAKISAEAITSVWQNQAHALQQQLADRVDALEEARAALEQVRTEHAEHHGNLQAAQQTAAHMAQELDQLRAGATPAKPARRGLLVGKGAPRR